MINKSVEKELAGKLERVLKHLNFSEIQVKNHPAYPAPEIYHDILKKQITLPSLVARKNDVAYYFVFIDSDPLFLNKNKHTLLKLINLGVQQWNTDFILVTKYDNKETVREWCQKHELPVDQIWEM